MSGETGQKRKLGEIFVEQGIITAKTRDRVLQRSLQLKRRFGSVLEELELVTGEELATALAMQYGCRPLTDLRKVRVSPDLLAMLPAETAMEHLILPLKREKDRVAMAMADPTDMRVPRNFSTNHGLDVVPFIAPRQAIRDAISRNYLGKEAVRPTARTVLVVDDDKLIRTMIGDVLRKEGYKVLTAGDGMEGFKTVIAEGPHVVIADMKMPKLDGYGLLSALRNIPETRYIPVIMITGKANPQEEEIRAFNKGFFDVIMKPLNPASIQARVKRAFHFYDYQYRIF